MCGRPTPLHSGFLSGLPWTGAVQGHHVSPYDIDRKFPRQRVWYVLIFTRTVMIGVCALIMVGACAKQPVRHGIPFDLDKVFSGLYPQPTPPPESWKEKGMRFAKEKNFSDAAEAFRMHILEEPESFFGFNALAVCYKNLGDRAQAMRNFERALEFAESPEERAKVLANIGNLYFGANKLQVALGYYKEAASEFPKNPIYLVLIARTFAFMGERDRARKVLQQTEKLRSDLDKYEREDDRGAGSYLMAYSYAGLNEEEKMFDYLEKALEANPTKYVKKIKEDISQDRSLLYTLRDDPRLKALLRKYSRRESASMDGT
jgi:tetratricopeptide (TPR) repeat protein